VVDAHAKTTLPNRPPDPGQVPHTPPPFPAGPCLPDPSTRRRIPVVSVFPHFPPAAPPPTVTEASTCDGCGGDFRRPPRPLRPYLHQAPTVAPLPSALSSTNSRLRHPPRGRGRRSVQPYRGLLSGERWLGFRRPHLIFFVGLGLASN
jgi:hypothetical protein